ncbi:hypothetical protein Tco_0059662 [Tanacetum coccineum]
MDCIHHPVPAGENLGEPIVYPGRFPPQPAAWSLQFSFPARPMRTTSPTSGRLYEQQEAFNRSAHTGGA